MTDSSTSWRPGRSCPLHYRYPPSVFAREPDMHADTLYVVGGLYGNRPALDALLAMAAEERGATAVVFNGDFNWFNVDPEGFEAVNAVVLSHRALRGNVETEAASDDTAVGCGCGYPDSVSAAEVDRSNEILDRLRRTARHFPALRARLGALPMHAVAQVGRLRIGVVHGDAESLAGWQFDASALDNPRHAQCLRAALAAADVDVFASSHTCLPALREFSFGERRRWVINNGAAGMPNFASTHFGVLTRVSIRPPAPTSSLYGIAAAGCFIDALGIRYDHVRWLDEFLANWSPGSPAHASYWNRIVHGPAWELQRAKPPGLG